MKAIILSAIVMLVLVAGCATETAEPPIDAAECTTDDDCIATGCSGHVCAPKSEGGIFTTCEWKSEYKCYKLINCACIEGRCQWEETAAFAKCVNDAKQEGGVVA